MVALTGNKTTNKLKQIALVKATSQNIVNWKGYKTNSSTIVNDAEECQCCEFGLFFLFRESAKNFLLNIVQSLPIPVVIEFINIKLYD